MTQARLIISPKSSSNIPAKTADIKQALKEAGLTANEFRNNAYYAGNNFISLVSFLGCSPNIQLTPEDGENFCFVEFSDTYPHSQLLGYCLSVKPKCPYCKAKIENWKDTAEYQLASSLYLCRKCNTVMPLSDLKWRQEGGYGHISISITNIHPHEAVPAEKILHVLKDASNFEWDYFYANNEIT